MEERCSIRLAVEKEENLNLKSLKAKAMLTIMAHLTGSAPASLASFLRNEGHVSSLARVLYLTATYSMARFMISVSQKGEWQLPAKERFKFMFLDLRLKS